MTSKEQTWQYDCHFTFNKQVIKHITLTDHWKEHHPQITKESIMKMFYDW